MILALDQGTTSSRAILFDAEGSAVAAAQQEFRQSYPTPGWVEHDPMEIWTTQSDTAREALQRAGIAAADVAAIGVANQRETTLLWDRKTGEPLAPAIVWQDRRTAGFCDELKRSGRGAWGEGSHRGGAVGAEAGEGSAAAGRIQDKTGLVLDAYFSGSKLRWLLDHIDGARKRAERGELAFGTVDSWLIWKATGGRLHITDPSNASRTLLFNIHTLQWDDELLELFGVPRSVLPDVRASSEVYGETEAEFLGRPVRIAGIAGDQQAALFGQGCVDAGLAKNTYGTGCFALMNTGQRVTRSKARLLSTVAWTVGGRTQYALEGSVFIGGAVVQWLRDGLGVIRSAGDVEALAASVPDTGGVYFVPAFAGLGAPHWDPYARGAIVGLTRGTTAAHIARAALEGIVFQVADVMRAMSEDSGVALNELRVDGGAARNNLLMQLQADVLGVPVARPRGLETTALGAAQLAGLAVGTWTESTLPAAARRTERVFEPGMTREAAAERCGLWREAVKRAGGWGGGEGRVGVSA